MDREELGTGSPSIILDEPRTASPYETRSQSRSGMATGSPVSLDLDVAEDEVEQISRTSGERSSETSRLTLLKLSNYGHKTGKID